MKHAPFALFIVCLSTAVVAEPAPDLNVSTQQRQALGIETRPVEITELIARPKLPGRIALPNHKVRVVTARTSGVLVSPSVAVGDHVEAGQELARLESPAYVSLQREYLEALSQLELARSTERRESQLAEEGIIAGRRAMESATRLREARTRLQEHGQALALAGMDEVELGALRKSRRIEPTSSLRAPTPGVVLEQYARAGERLDSGDPLYRIGELDALTVEIHTPLELARSLRAGMGFEIEGTEVVGQIDAVGREVHSADQGVLVRGSIEEGGHRLRPGQFVRVQFQTGGGGAAAFAVPSRAVVHLASRAWVFRETGHGFEPVAVDIVGGSGTRTVLSGPLAEGEAIAVQGTAALKALWLAAREPE